MMKIAIIDYEVGNLANVYNAWKRLGIEAVITRDPAVIRDADMVELPGVGAIRDAMGNLQKFDLIPLLQEQVQSGKFFMGVCLGMQALFEKSYEGGTYDCLGFLPGDMKEKIDPYLQPLYDALQDMIPGAKLNEYMERGVIQIAPLAFMRGRTLADAIVILDEAQNTTTAQLKMFLTRLGVHGKMIITGDLTQIDLPASQKSGLQDAIERLRDIKGIAMVEFNQKDIVRHHLVKHIVDAYNRQYS